MKQKLDAENQKTYGAQTIRDFRVKGETIAKWAVERKFNPRLVYAVLRGERKCLRGESYKIAKALGMK